jgi:hypothetical protein
LEIIITSNTIVIITGFSPSGEMIFRLCRVEKMQIYNNVYGL